MSIHLPNNYYCRAFLRTSAFDLESYKDNPTFSCIEPSLAAYSKQYADKGYLGRKITAIPHALWTGVVKTTFHLGKAVIKTMNGNSKNRVYFFAVVRDLQETFGRILCVFNDRIGLYHIQQARFYQKLYAISTESYEEDLNETQIREPANRRQSGSTSMVIDDLINQAQTEQAEFKRQIEALAIERRETLKNFLRKLLVEYQSALEQQNSLRENMGQLSDVKRARMLRTFESLHPSDLYKNLIDSNLRIYQSNGGLTTQQINRVLDELRGEFPGHEFSFLEELKKRFV